MKLFGPAYSRALRDASSDLAPYLPANVWAAEWILLVACYESAAWRYVDKANAHGYSGQFQRAMVNGVLYIDLPGRRDPAVQVRDYAAFTIAQINATFTVAGRKFRLGRVNTLAEFYALNLAPARASCGVIYAHPKAPLKPDEHPPESAEEAEEVAFAARWWPTAWAAQDAKLDPERKGWIRKRDLEAPIRAAAAAHRERIEAELAAVRAL